MYAGIAMMVVEQSRAGLRNNTSRVTAATLGSVSVIVVPVDAANQP